VLSSYESGVKAIKNIIENKLNHRLFTDVVISL